MNMARRIVEQLKAMKPSERAAIEAFVASTIVLVLLYAFVWPSMPFLVGALIWLGGVAGYYESRLKILARIKLADTEKL